MKKVLLSLSTLLIAVFMIACGSKSTTITVESFKDQAPSLVDKQVTITGVAKHICQHSGRKLFLAESEDGETMVKVFTGKDMDPFDKTTIGKTYTVNGIVKISQTIDNAYLDDWEKEVKESIEKGEVEEEHCGTESKANGIEADVNTENPQLAQIAAMRKKIAENGGNPLVFYHIECTSYEMK